MEGADILMDKDQILEMHGDMLNWATEIIKASIPSLRRSYKRCYDNWAPEGVASRFKDDRNSEELSNYTVWNEALQFLEVMNNGEEENSNLVETPTEGPAPSPDRNPTASREG
jgi:hypothetical protein